MTKEQAIKMFIKEKPGLVVIGVKEIKEGFVLVVDRKNNKRKDGSLISEPVLVYHSGKTIPYNPIAVKNYDRRNVPK